MESDQIRNRIGTRCGLLNKKLVLLPQKLFSLLKLLIEYCAKGF